MKKILFTLVVLSFTVVAFAQVPSINSFYRKYKVEEGVFHAKVPGFVVRLASNIAKNYADTEQEAALFDLMGGMRTVRVLAGEQVEVATADINQLITGLTEDQFEPLLEVGKKDMKVRIFMRQKKEYVKALFILVNELEGLTMLSLKTKIPVEQIDELLMATALESMEGGDFLSLD